MNYYEILDDEKLQLINYVNNLPFIFDISLVNTLTNGKKFNHIYRKKKDVCHKKKKLQKSRSRDYDNESELDKSSSSNEE